ncbi:MAG: hypothetical protein ACSLFM_01965 [Tepidiformaceae bacterium]
MSRRLALLNLVLVGALLTGVLVFVVLGWTSENQSSIGPDVIALPALALLAVLGYVILSRYPTNRIGIGMAAVALCGSTFGLADGYASHGLYVDPGSLPAANYAAWVVNWLWIWVLMAPVTLLLLHAPDGQLPSGRWRPVLVLDFVALGLLTVTQMFQPGNIEDFPIADNPFGLDGLRPLVLALNLGGFILLLPAVGCSGAALLVRFLRSTGRERLQLKWLAAAAAGVILLNVLSWVVSFFGPDVWDYSSILAFCLVPAAAAVAILKHQLYDIDILINRTLVYGSLTAATIGSYLLLVVGLSWGARFVSGEGGNEIVVAATTLIVAALFQPARRRIQRVVDRRFYRSRYDAARTLDAFQVRLRDEVDLPTLQRDLARVVATTLQPERVGVWLKEARHR